MNRDETRRLVQAVRALPQHERVRRMRALMEQAPLFDLEVSAACNAVCSFCPRGDMQRRTARMTDDTFAAVLDFLPPDAVVMVSGLGDALLHPRLPDYLGRLRDAGHSCCVITNGIALTPATQRLLFDSGVAQLQISVHGLERAVVEHVMTKGSRPARVHAHLLHLAQHRPPGLRVRINFVETERNAAALQEVQALACRLGFDFFWRQEHSRGGSLGPPSVPRRREGCGIFSAVTFISADGDVLPCVNDVGGEGCAGNVRVMTWDQVVRWKRTVMDGEEWFRSCEGCDDDYRWVLIGQGQLDETEADAKDNGQLVSKAGQASRRGRSATT